MLGTIYTGLTGLQGFSKGLDVISNNVANLNTIGFKSSQMFFQDLMYQYRRNETTSGGLNKTEIGTGVDTSATFFLFRQGELRSTKESLDVAIDGNGFLINRKDGQTFYSRAGQLGIDADGFLINKTNNSRVAGIYGNNSLENISVNGYRTYPAKPTSVIKFVDDLSSGSTQHVLADQVVYDSTGAAHKLTFTFKNQASVLLGSWLVEVTDVTGALVGTGEIRYQANLPLADFNTITFSFSPPGAAPTDILLDFGDPGTSSGTTNYSSGTNSRLLMASQNGYAAGSLSKLSFDESGNLTAEYSNGKTQQIQQLALAWFDNLQGLTEEGGGLFRAGPDQSVKIARAGEHGMGKLAPGKLELSNVELTEQFTDMIIIQRGYQGSSQIISVANEMIQQLYDIKGRK